MQELEIIKGSDRPVEIQLMEDDCGTLKVFNLENNTEVKAIFKKDDGTNLEKLKSTGGVEVVSEANGEIKIKFEPADTESLREGKCQSFEVEVTKSTDGGLTTDTYIWQFEEILKVKGRVV